MVRMTQVSDAPVVESATGPKGGHRDARTFVEKSEASLGGILAAAWHDPYILGFISTPASLEARAAVGGNLGSAALGLIQSETVAELSGASASLHGEEILTLSMDGDPQFQSGCSQAMSFHAALRRSQLVPIGTAPEVFAMPNY